MNQLAEIKRLYYQATRATIAQDVARAVELLKSMSSDEERQRAAVYMDGLSQMRSEWAAATGNRRKGPYRRHNRSKDRL